MKSLFTKQLFVFTAVVLSVIACKQPETIIIRDDPTAASAGDTARSKMPDRDAGFQKLVLGELNPIESLNPLFADNATEMRAVQLIYEGLVRLNENGQIIPAMANNWTVSDDSLRYEFHLRPDVFYHDNDIFSTGTGRRLTTEDVKFAFEQMAKAGVPPRAARLFMNIKGFDSYFQEQHFVYNPENRQLKSITGIETISDTNIVFKLVQKDSEFLKKLATPLAVVYPKEALNESENSFTAVGTGPFIFTRKTADSTYIFSKFENYYTADEIELSRVDMVISKSEMQLFKSVSAGEINLLPQLGPQLMQEILTENAQLLLSYDERYTLLKPGGFTEYVLRYNSNSELPASVARNIAGLIKPDSGSYFAQMPQSLIQTQSFVVGRTPVTNEAASQEVYTTFSTDPFVKTFLGSLSETLDARGTSLQMLKVHTPIKKTGLLFTRDFPLIPGGEWSDYEKLFSFEVAHTALLQPSVNGLSFNQYLWWINLRTVSVESENLN